MRELYLSLNIFSIGEYVQGLREHGSNLQNIYVLNDENRYINNYDRCVYK